MRQSGSFFILFLVFAPAVIPTLFCCACWLLCNTFFTMYGRVLSFILWMEEIGMVGRRVLRSPVTTLLLFIFIFCGEISDIIEAEVMGQGYLNG